jgi:hypothetical protein
MSSCPDCGAPGFAEFPCRWCRMTWQQLADHHAKHSLPVPPKPENIPGTAAFAAAHEFESELDGRVGGRRCRPHQATRCALCGEVRKVADRARIAARRAKLRTTQADPILRQRGRVSAGAVVA